MVRRSLLFAPGDEPRKMRKATETPADVAVFDLEDAVSPQRKGSARDLVASAISDALPEATCCVRVNPCGAGMEEDVAAIADGSPPDSLMLPKTDSADDVSYLDNLLTEHDIRLPILALIETAEGVLAAEDIARAPATDALLFGAEDLAADIGATRTPEGTEVLFARQRVVLAAATAGIEAIDTVFTDFTDSDGLREETKFAAQLGFVGKMVIHPNQVPIVNEAFTPSDAEVAWAERVREANTTTDTAVFEVDGEMIDAPLVKQAERILERAGNG